MAFFPCIHFCDAKTLFFKGVHRSQEGKPLASIMWDNIQLSRERQRYYELLLMLVGVAGRRGLRLIIENPYNPNGATYLQNNFIKPSIIDKDRTMRGDYYVKPTGYWFFNCTPTTGLTIERTNRRNIKNIMDAKKNAQAGVCSEERSLISPCYARNFICDFVIGKEQQNTIPTLF